jgi:two-component system response regulator
MPDKMILIVEDDPDDEALTLRALKQNNIVNDIVVARDGAEALDYLFASGTYTGRDLNIMPQIILLDLKLPKIDGLEVLRRLRTDERTKRLPVVILTSSNEESDVVNSYVSGANSYVRKPIVFQEFLDTVRQVGTYWVQLNEAPPPLRRNT